MSDKRKKKKKQSTTIEKIYQVNFFIIKFHNNELYIYKERERIEY